MDSLFEHSLQKGKKFFSFSQLQSQKQSRGKQSKEGNLEWEKIGRNLMLKL
jgi:hypothetical protein